MGASKTLHDVQALGIARVLVHGSFRPNGASGIVTGSQAGKGWTPTRQSAGTYRITFDDKFPAMPACSAWVRAASAVPAFVTGGDFSASNKTLDLRVWSGTKATKLIPVSLFDLCKISRSKTVRILSAEDMVLDSGNPPTLNETAGGYAFDADAEQARISFRIPDDWDGASDINLEVIWHPEAGTALADTETVEWEAVYYSRANGEAVDGGTAVTTDATETQSGAGVDKEEYRTAIVLDYDSANQPLAAGDTVYLLIARDFTTDTYAADAVITGFNLTYNTAAPSYKPRIERVNGATDQAYRVVWPAGDVSEVVVPPIPKPDDLDAAVDLTIHAMAKMSSTNDTPTVDIKCWDGEGDTEMGGATAALSDSLAEVSRTIANANVAAAPGFLNVSLVPGAHATDALYLYALWLEYTSSDEYTWALTDLTADADNAIQMEALYRNSSIAY